MTEPAPGERRSLSRRAVLTTMGALPVLAATARPATAAAAVVIDPSARRQTIRGFGGMAHAAWIGDLTAAQRDTAFGAGEGRLGFSVLRIPVPENQADWSRDLATARRAAELGATVIASPWNPPAGMVETFVRGSQTNARRLKYGSYGAYAQHLNDFTTYMRNNGVNLYGISVQNEPDYAQEWTWWTPAEMVRFLRENAGSISTRVIAPESFQYLKNMSDPILNDSAALANVDIIGAHLYGTPYANFPYPLFQQKGAGKELWMTEVYHPNSSDSADLWPQALDVGEHIHHAMVDAEFQAYVWWYIRRSYGPMREDGQLSKRGANMAQFARFVRPGYVRIAATANPVSNVYVSAYRGGDGTVAIVAINKTTSAVSQQFTLAGGTASSVSSWVTDASRNVAPQGAAGVSNGSFTATLPARSVTTFVTGVTQTPGGVVDTSAWYVLVNRNSGKALDVYNLSTADGGRITQWIRNSQNQQQWQFVDSGGGYYRVKSRHSGKVLDVYNFSTANGGAIVQWTDTNGNNQQWRLADSPDGYVRLISRHSNKALEVQGASTADGANIVQYDDWGGTNQQWQLARVG
ncbi:RICIN domain-containing protein [Nonomuraea sp. LP-02]|uniref:RICIN domain-containing protein n=1 Tax=Nonomuraea sp. LP-02 TaxID=3097960 RepID=UPI002E2F7D42|nr:RICIN domain-containing protein [Nonomuraea sp. LP-02]MED7930628.1 RICIN domain-containing protein [Nonomuraea sp. LP-02]